MSYNIKANVFTITLAASLTTASTSQSLVDIDDVYIPFLRIFENMRCMKEHDPSKQLFDTFFPE